MRSADFWEAIRAEFRLDRRHVHLGCFWLSSYPRNVRRAINQHRRRLDANPVLYVTDNERRLDCSARGSIAKYIGGDEEAVVLVESTTEGLMLAIGGLSIGPDSHVLVTTHEHYSARAAVDALVSRSGAALTVAELYNDSRVVTKESMISALLNAIRGETRVVVITWVHSCTGVRLPLAEIADEIQRINAARPLSARILLCVDATHGFGALSVDLSSTPCDIFVSSCHKWLNGPHGTGFVHFSAFAEPLLRPLLPSFAPAPLAVFTGRGPAVSAPWERLTPGGFHAFENRWAIPAAIRFCESIGIDEIEDRICQLSARLKDLLARAPGVTIITPIERTYSAGIVCFEIRGIQPATVVGELRRRGVVASVSPYRIAYARLTPGVYNNESDLEFAAKQVFDIAAGATEGR